MSAVSELQGTWTGTSGWVCDWFYIGESIFTLHIREDGTFTALVTPNGGANNLAKRSTLSGTVVANGSRVTLQNTEGPWTWLTLVRSGNTLYGVAVDPAFEGNVMLWLDRERALGGKSQKGETHGSVDSPARTERIPHHQRGFSCGRP